MAATTYQLINGVWHTTTLNAADALARANAADMESALQRLPPPTPMPPALGLLSRTVLRSPVVKQLIPARLRGPDFNDVAVLGESYVHLYELRDDGMMKMIAQKNDLQGNVRSGVAVKLRGYQKNDGIKKEDPDAPEGPQIGRLPPEILMLSLDSGMLMALGMIFTEDVGFEWKSGLVKLHTTAGILSPEQLGYSLHVDPSSRCFAVTTFDNALRLYKLFTYEELKIKYESDRSIIPFSEEFRGFGATNSVTIGSCFLYPSSSEPKHVFFLQIFADVKSKFRAMLIEWDTSLSVLFATRNSRQGIRFSEEMRTPLHVISIPEKSAFAIITDTNIHIGTISDIKCGNTQLSHTQPLPHIEARHSGSHSNVKPKPLVSSWASAQNGPYGFYGGLYLAYENGAIHHLELSRKKHHFMFKHKLLTKLDSSLSQALAYAVAGERRFLVGAGELSTIGLFTYGLVEDAVFSAPVPEGEDDDEDPNFQQISWNWSPVHDFAVTPLKSPEATPSTTPETLMFCSGLGEEGSVIAIKTGTPSQIQSFSDYLPFIRNLFVLTEANENGFYSLCSTAEDSNLAYLSLEGEWESIQTHVGLDLSSPTVLAMSFVEGTVQITPNAIYFGKLVYGEAEPQSWRKKSCNPGEEIVAASMLDNKLVLGIRRGESVYLVGSVIDITQEDSELFLRQVGEEIVLFNNPTSINLVRINSSALAIVGTRDATIQIYHFNSEYGLVPTLEESLTDSGEPPMTQEQQDDYLAESVALISTSHTSKLLVGLRGGKVTHYTIKWKHDQAELSNRMTIPIGIVPPHLQESSKNPSVALLHIGGELHTVTLGLNGHISTSPILLRDVEGLGITAYGQVAEASVEETVIVGITSANSIFYANIEGSERPCAIPYESGGETPRKIFWYDSIKCFVVACGKVCDGSATALKESCCSLRFINPASGRIHSERALRDSKKGDLIFSKLHEQIHCIQEWSFTIDGAQYNYLIFGTGYRRPETNERKGRLLVLSLHMSTDPKTGFPIIEARRRFQYTLESAATAICATGNDLAFTSGETLTIVTVDSISKRFMVRAEHNMHSKTRSLSFIPPNTLLASTIDESLISLSISSIAPSQTNPNPTFIGLGSLTITPQGCDPITRLSSSHLILDKKTFLNASLQGDISLFHEATSERHSDAFHVHSDGILARPVNKLAFGSVPIPEVPKGVIAYSPDGSGQSRRMLGLSQDGTLQTFQVLKPAAYKLLECIYKVILKDDEEAIYYYANGGLIDGDLLEEVWRSWRPERARGVIEEVLGTEEAKEHVGGVFGLDTSADMIWDWIGDLVKGGPGVV